MQAFARDTRGAIAVMTALVLPVLIGVAAYAIDASLLLYRQERLQIAVDIGARAGAEMLRDGRPQADAIAFAQSLTLANVAAPDGSVPEITVTIPDPARIEVTAALDVDRIFARVFGVGAFRVHAASVAVITMAAEPQTCVYVDHPDAAAALDIAVNVALTGCQVIVASTGLGDPGGPFAPPEKRSVSLASRGHLTATCLMTAGRVNRPQRVTSDCPGILASTPVPPPDPLPAAPPTTGNCSGGGGAGNSNAAWARFRAGRPSCGTVRISGTESLPAGIYVVSDGNLEMPGNAQLTLAEGSVLVLMDTARIVMNLGAELVIAAPTEGPLAGVAILAAQDPPRPNPVTHALGRLDVEGLIALPGETVLLGGGAAAGRCTRLRAGTLAVTTADLALTCTPVDTGSTVKLVPSGP